MRIGVNYRLGLNPVSGVPLTIKYLYSALVKIDPTLVFIKFTPIINSLSLFFDTIVCYFLLLLRPVDIFHGPSYVLPWWKPKNVKFVVTIHDLAFLVHPEVATMRFRIIYKFLTAHSLSIADLVIAVSDNTKRDILEYFSINAEKIVVIPNGVSDTYFTSKSLQPLIQGDYLLTVTTHPQRKNTPMLLEAFQLISNKNLKLVIVGNIGQDDKYKLEELALRLRIIDKIIFTGGVSESGLVSLYQHAKLFVYPSTYEGFGIPLLEAMACGCLVLGSRASSLPEIIPDFRCLFYPIDTPTLAQSINELLFLPAKDRGLVIKRHKEFASKYSWTNSASRYLSSFKKLL